MSLEKVIEEKLTEWRGKTIASNDQFMNELEHTLRSTYLAGFDAGGQTVGGTGRIMYERGLAEGRAETNEEAYQQGVKDTKDSYQKGYKDGATALLTELGKVEEKHSNASDRGDMIVGGNDDGWNDCLATIREKGEEYLQAITKSVDLRDEVQSRKDV